MADYSKPKAATKSVATKSFALVCTLEIDEQLWWGSDLEEQAWFKNLLLTDTLWLHSDEVGDTVGQVRVTDLKLKDSEAKTKGNSKSPSDPKRKANT